MRHDPRALRAEFPIFAAQPAPFRYLDNAATGQICRAAADALWRYETTQRANVKRGVYRLADAATNAFQHAREEPEPAREPAWKPKVAALVLAAGQSRRMGERNKLLIEVDGRSMLRHAVEAAMGAGVRETVVVTGHERERVEAALAGLPVRFVHNPDYAGGLSTSLKAGIGALGRKVDGALVLLGDMPRVTAEHLRRLIEAFDPAEGRGIVVPTHLGKRGNPVLWSRAYFARMRDLQGDVGAKHLIGEHAELVCEVEMDTDGVLVDIDTPEALAEFRDKTKPSAA